MGIKDENRGFLGQIGTKIRGISESLRDDIFIILAIFLISLAAFGMGRLSVIWETKGEFKVIYPEHTGNLEENALFEGGKYVASISGSKYHLPYCSGAKRIKEDNKIWFQTREEAKIAGYTPAANCPGL